MRDRKPFAPLDLGNLPHYPRSAAVNAETIPALTAPDRVTALVGAHPDHTGRLLNDLDRAADAVSRAIDTHPHLAPLAGPRVPCQLRRLVVLPVVAAIAALGVGAAVTPPAQAAVRVTTKSTATDGPGLTLRAGAHHRGSLHAGAYVLSGREMYCISYGAQMGDGPTHAGTQAAQVTYLLDTWGNTTSPVQAADVYLAVDSLAASDAFRADLPGYLAQLPDGGKEVHAMLAQAARLAGPWHIAVTVPAAAPGTSAVAHVTVTSASGAPVPAAAITSHALGGTLATSTVSTDGAGVAAVAVTPTTLADTITASTSGPGTTVEANTPSAGHQVLVGAGPLQTVTGSGCATVCPVSATVSLGAACTDHGTHALTVIYSADATPGTYRAVLTVDGVAATSPLATGSTVTMTAQVHAGSTVAVSWQALDGSGTVILTQTLAAETVTA